MRVKNWKQFQHYKKRNPPWIRLYRNLLDNYEFQCLPLASKALAPQLWLLASESITGDFDGTPEKIAFRLRMSLSDVKAGLKPLIEHGFFEDASTMLASCNSLATPETETETETEKDMRATPSTPQEFIFTLGKKLLGEKAGSIIGYARKQVGDEKVTEVLACMSAMSPPVSDPVPYFIKATTPKPRRVAA